MNPVGTATVAQNVNLPTALNARKHSIQSWIVDSGASDHMTGDLSVFHDDVPNFDNYTIRIADGTLSKVVGIGTVIISKDITLNSILFVPNLDCNLLSVSKITRDFNCITKFSSNICVFQVLNLARKIGSAKLWAGFYLLNAEISGS